MNDNLNIAFLMDPLESLDLNGDTTFALALEAQRRKHKISFFKPEDLILKSNNVYANICKLELSSINNKNDFKYHETFIKPLKDYDVIMMRQDPPFDMAYITATHILEKLTKSTLVVNNPAEVRNSPEKIFVTNFSHLMPKTIITRNLKVIENFRNEYNDIIVKPLYGNGGQGIFHVLPNDENFNSILEMFFCQNKEPLMIQEYLKDVRDGDKRIILLNGEPVGAINRIPKKGESRSNMHVGGKPEKTQLTKRDRFICDEISDSLKKKGLYFVGIDIIGDYITEINVTSPTGIREIRALESVVIEEMFWDFIEKKIIY
jgi:glutathione synthase